jgi:hypothetical protein
MYIQVDQDGPATLAEADNFRAFSVVVNGKPEQLGAALAGLGALDGDHAWLDPGAVKALASDAVGEQWHAEFDNMISYAQSKGWTDTNGRVRAHIEYR